MKTAILGVCLSAFALAATDQPVERRLDMGNSPSPRDLQEMATLVRTVFDIQELSIEAPSGIRLRGPSGPVSGIDWMMRDLQEPPEIRNRSAHEYIMGVERFPVVRAFYLNPASGPERVQEMITVLRAVANVQRIYSFMPSKVLIMRDTDAEVKLAAWIVKELEDANNQTDGYSGVHQFRSDVARDDVVRIFFAEHRDNPDFSPVVRKIQSTGQRAFFVPSSSALVVRGTADLIVADEKLIGVR